MTTSEHPLDDQLRAFSWNTLTPAQARELCRQARGLPGLAHSDADGGFYLAARYDDVVGVMGHPETFSSAPTVLRPQAPGVPPFAALEQDPPEHGPWREIYRGLINPRTVKRLRSQILDDVNHHIDLVIESGTCDLIHDLAEFVPAETICRAAGIEDMDIANQIRVAALAGVAAAGREPEALPARLAEFAALVMPLIDDRRANPRDDFLTRLISAQPGGRPLEYPDFVGTLFGLLAAGHHSTTSAMGNLFLDVLTRPHVRQAVAADVGTIPIVIEESLRLDPPFYGFFRRVVEPTQVAGTQMDADESVCLGWASANMDAEQFQDPESFRLDRRPNKHVTFGYGIHTCVGAPLARLELQIVLEQVMSRMPDIELTVTDVPKYFGGAGATYLESLPARFTPGTVLDQKAGPDRKARSQ